jgi:hypothetical protein
MTTTLKGVQCSQQGAEDKYLSSALDICVSPSTETTDYPYTLNRTGNLIAVFLSGLSSRAMRGMLCFYAATRT